MSIFTCGNLCGAMIVISLCASLVSCGGVRRSDISGFSAGENPEIPSRVYRVLALAAYAPSGHNTQPWVVTVTGDDSFRAAIDPARRLPGVDPGNRELMLSMGAFLEAISVAAAIQGEEARISVTAKNAADISVADVKLVKRAIAAPFTENDMRLRRVVRKGHLAKEISSDDLEYITRDIGESCAYFSALSDTGKTIARLTVDANRAQAYRNEAQEELSHWIRFADTDARARRDGLTPESMEITGLSGFAVRHFFDADSVMKDSFRERSVDLAKELTSSYGGWILVQSSGNSVADLIDAGRRFYRLSLRVRRRMIAIHPMTQILEEKPIRDEFVRATRIKGETQFILRTSYLRSYPEPVSLRRPPEDFIRR